MKSHGWYIRVTNTGVSISFHDDVIKRKHFPLYWPFVRGTTGRRWIPLTNASDAERWVLLVLRLHKRLSKQSRCWRFETPSCSLWLHCNAFEILIWSSMLANLCHLERYGMIRAFCYACTLKRKVSHNDYFVITGCAWVYEEKICDRIRVSHENTYPVTLRQSHVFTFLMTSWIWHTFPIIASLWMQSTKPSPANSLHKGTVVWSSVCSMLLTSIRYCKRCRDAVDLRFHDHYVTSL